MGDCQDRSAERRWELQRDEADWKGWLWRKLIEMQGQTFITSGRGKRPGVEFSYFISSCGGKGGRKYKGPEIEGYGNELWIIRDGQRKRKSASRSTVELAYTRYMELLKEKGEVKGPKALGIPGAGSYLYSVIKRIEED